MKRILYLTRAHLSFSRAHSQNILKTAETISKENTRSVRVFSSAPEEMPAADILKTKEIAPVFQLDISPKKRNAFFSSLKERRAYDMFYFRDPYLWHIAFIMRFLFRKKIVFEAHGSHEWKYQKFVWFLAVGTAHGVVFITEALRDYYATKKPSVVAACYGIDVTKFKIIESAAESRSRLSLPKDATIVMYAGSLLWYSMDVLIGMISLLPPSNILVIVGAKEEEQNVIRALAIEKGVADRVTIRSRVAHRDVASYLFAADVLVNPLVITYPGSISAKLYEYLAAGKPIVSSFGGANKEIIAHEKNGLLVDLSPKEFADAVRRIEENPALHGALSRNAKESARRYTWEARAERIISLLEKL